MQVYLNKELDLPIVEVGKYVITYIGRRETYNLTAEEPVASLTSIFLLGGIWGCLRETPVSVHSKWAGAVGYLRGSEKCLAARYNGYTITVRLQMVRGGDYFIAN